MSSSQSSHVIIQNVQAVLCTLQSETCIKYDKEHAVSIPWKICTINEFRQHNKARANHFISRLNALHYTKPRS